LTGLRAGRNLRGLMIGAVELVRELRNLGSSVAEVAEYLGLRILMVEELPVSEAIFMLQSELGLLVACDEMSVWVGLGSFLLHEMDLEIPTVVVYEAASRLMRESSGLFPAVRIA